MLGLLLVSIGGGILSLLYHYHTLRWRSQCLEKQLQTYQKLMDQTFTDMHNGPVQLLIVLMREVQLRDLPQTDLLQHLHHVYQDVLSGVQQLQDNSLEKQQR